MTKKIKANLYEISRFQCQENYRETAPYLEQPGHHCLHLLKNNTSCTRNLFPWLGESTDANKALLFFTGWEEEFKVLAISHSPLCHCLRKDFFNCDFNRKYSRHGRLYGRLCRTRAFCVHRLSGPQCYLSSFQLFQQKRFNCISIVSCKGSVCVEVLSSFYGRLFVEEGQFIKYTPSTSSHHLGSHFLNF